MINANYRLRYLPLFFDDVNGVIWYIKNELSNPQAANDLIAAVEVAILQRQWPGQRNSLASTPLAKLSRHYYNKSRQSCHHIVI